MTQKDLEKRIKDAQQPLVVTGAGVSTLSGVPDYTTMQGMELNNRYFQAREILSRPFFQAYSREFWIWHKQQFLQKLEPNKVHRWIAKQTVPVLTQNIDGLHRLAGSKDVIEFHGKADKGICQICLQEIDLRDEQAIMEHAHGLTSRDPLAILADHVDTQIILYGDAIDSCNLALAASWTQSSDCILVIGSTLEVYPLAGLVLQENPNKIIWLDKTKNKVARSHPDIRFIQTDFRDFFED